MSRAGLRPPSQWGAPLEGAHPLSTVCAVRYGVPLWANVHTARLPGPTVRVE